MRLMTVLCGTDRKQSSRWILTWDGNERLLHMHDLLIIGSVGLIDGDVGFIACGSFVRHHARIGLRGWVENQQKSREVIIAPKDRLRKNICYKCTYIVLVIYRANSFHIHLQHNEGRRRNMNIKLLYWKSAINRVLFPVHKSPALNCFLSWWNLPARPSRRFSMFLTS